MIYPWQPIISSQDPVSCGKILIFPNPWRTQDKPMIYPWQSVIFSWVRCPSDSLRFHGFFGFLYNSLGRFLKAQFENALANLDFGVWWNHTCRANRWVNYLQGKFAGLEAWGSSCLCWGYQGYLVWHWPRVAHKPSIFATRRNPKICNWPWNVKSTMMATYNFAASPFLHYTVSI